MIEQNGSMEPNPISLASEALSLVSRSASSSPVAIFAEFIH